MRAMRDYGVMVPPSFPYGITFRRDAMAKADAEQWCQDVVEDRERYHVQTFKAWTEPYIGVAFAEESDVMMFRLSFPDIELFPL